MDGWTTRENLKRLEEFDEFLSYLRILQISFIKTVTIEKLFRRVGEERPISLTW